MKKVAIAGIIAGVLGAVLASVVFGGSDNNGSAKADGAPMVALDGGGIPGGDGQMPGDGDHGGMGDGFRGGPGGDDIAGAADALGMTSDELQTALNSGKTIADLAKDKGVDIDTVIDAMLQSMKAHFDAEVASGEHSQEEADAMLSDMRTRLEAMVNGQMPMGPDHDGGMGDDQMTVTPPESTNPTN